MSETLCCQCRGRAMGHPDCKTVGCLCSCNSSNPVAQIATLRAQLAAAQERVKGLENADMMMRLIMQELHIDVAQRDAEIAELRKDQARLDAVIEHRLFLSSNNVQWRCYSRRAELEEALHGKTASATPREAIDAAIKAAESKGETS